MRIFTKSASCVWKCGIFFVIVNKKRMKLRTTRLASANLDLASEIRPDTSHKASELKR